MKRIRKLEFENYKFFKSNFTIDLPQGKNLLIYGENGSGKSSLYKGLDFFFQRSINGSAEFQHNIYSDTHNGKIKVYFTSDQDDNIEISVASTKADECNFNRYVISASKTRGFWDYSKLLKIYLQGYSSPDLFPLLFELLKDYIPAERAGLGSIEANYNKVYDTLHSIKRRGSKNIIKAEAELTSFHEIFQFVLDKVSNKTNKFLEKYFEHFEIKIRFELEECHIPAIGSIKNLTPDYKLYMKVKHGELEVQEYKEILNEARLSALASCLLLSITRTYPIHEDFQILFLDDIFLGLDMGNRLPLLEIIKSEFASYQIFLTTYDYSWFEMSKDILGCEWMSIEMYSTQEKNQDGIRENIPILIKEETYLDKARRHLLSSSCPDYPAAANYFRKHLEKILPEIFPRSVVSYDNHADSIPTYRLTNILKRSILLVRKLANYPKDLNELMRIMERIESFLPALLHPLSHHSSNLKLYKKELLEIERLINKLDTIGRECEFFKTVCVLSECDSKVCMQLMDNKNRQFNYVLILKEHLIAYEDENGQMHLANCINHIIEIKGKDLKTKQEFYNKKFNEESELYKNSRADSLESQLAKTIKLIESKEYEKDYGTNEQVIRPVRNIDCFLCLEDRYQKFKDEAIQEDHK